MLVAPTCRTSFAELCSVAVAVDFNGSDTLLNSDPDRLL